MHEATTVNYGMKVLDENSGKAVPMRSRVLLFFPYQFTVMLFGLGFWVSALAQAPVAQTPVAQSPVVPRSGFYVGFADISGVPADISGAPHSWFLDIAYTYARTKDQTNSFWERLCRISCNPPQTTPPGNQSITFSRNHSRHRPS
jgi:hypothetical protein